MSKEESMIDGQLIIISILVAALIGCGVCIASLLDQRANLLQFCKTMMKNSWNSSEIINIAKGARK